MHRAWLTALVVLLISACGGHAVPAPVAAPGGPEAPVAAPPAAVAPVEVATVDVPPAIRAVVDAADRDPADRALDAGRRPDQLLAFAGIRPGMRVAEILAGGGYTTELLARAVAPGGTVYAENPGFVYQAPPGKPWLARLDKPVMSDVVRVDRELDDPFPAEARDLDAVFLVLVYHDTVWHGVDRPRLLRAVFDALAPGGSFVVVDHRARDGAGIDDVQTLHRIEEAVVRREVAAAGFELAAVGGFLANPDDPRDWNDSPVAAADRRGTSDRFVLRFVKPAASPPAAGVR